AAENEKYDKGLDLDLDLRLRNSQDSEDDVIFTNIPLDDNKKDGNQVNTELYPPGVYYSTDTLNTPRSVGESEIDSGILTYGEDENKERGNWSGKLDFLLSCLGYAVGLGNVWRFPYLCYRNGGGAFLIPYAIMLVFVGLPLFFMELCLGQFCSSGPLTCWSYAPMFKGIGVAMMIVSSLVAVYYNMIIAWSLYYLIASFTSELPWADCDNDWNGKGCSLRWPLLKEDECQGRGTIEYPNGTCYTQQDDKTYKFTGVYNESLFFQQTKIKRILPSEEYYNNYVLNLSSGIDDMGAPQWKLVLALIGAWVIAFMCMIKGIKSSGKVVYFTATFPYVVLVILLIRGVTLDNAGQGILFYLQPDWQRLGNAKVWNDAAVQIFFSLSNCWGGLIALASYNRFHNNCLRDTLIVAFGNCCTSVFAGFVIFSFLGNMAGIMNTTVDKVVDSGPGLAFIVYPFAVTMMPVSPLWAILFFFMLITLGLDSQFAMLETVMTSIMDQFPHVRKKKTFIILFISILFFLCGLTLTCRGGAYMLQLMDTYCGGWAILIIGIVESISIAWIYGADRFMNDIALMTGKKPSIWWRICWQGLTPFLIIFILLFTWIDYSPARFGDYSFPEWADGLGWCMSFTSVIFIPIMAVYKLSKEEGSFLERLRRVTTPSIEWGPALVKHRRLVNYVNGFWTDPKAALGVVNPAMSYSSMNGSSVKVSYNGVPISLTPGYSTPGYSTPGGESIDGRRTPGSQATGTSYISQANSSVSYESVV
ncbi:unnamed protein product, partial [Owenia fusiformis]